MIDPIREPKTRAEILHHRITARDPPALVRLRVLPGYSGRPLEDLEAAAPRIQRRQCLAVLANEFGFSGWPHAKQVISGNAEASDFGTWLCPSVPVGRSGGAFRWGVRVGC